MDRRNTQQKERVLDAVHQLHRHVSADEVYIYLRQRERKIGRGTVYRNLNVLVSEGRLSKVAIPAGPMLYEAWKEKHYHAVCSVCGEIMDVAIDKGLDFTNFDTRGFIIEDCDVFFRVTCSSCKKR